MIPIDSLKDVEVLQTMLSSPGWQLVQTGMRNQLAYVADIRNAPFEDGKQRPQDPAFAAGISLGAAEVYASLLKLPDLVELARVKLTEQLEASDAKDA